MVTGPVQTADRGRAATAGHDLRPSLPEGTVSAMLPALAHLEAAAAAATVHGAGTPVVVVDYGASAGRHSMLPVSRAVETLRRRIGRQRSVLVVHTDGPSADFSPLFATLADDPASYRAHDPAVFSAAVGRSAYEQLLPSASVTLGWTSQVFRSLRRTPAGVADHVHAGWSADVSVRRSFAGQAARDWHDFVAFRGRELADGGRLVVLTAGVDDDGTPGFTAPLRALTDAVAELTGAGLVTADEQARMTLPTHARSEDDLVAPFAPSGRLESVAIERLEQVRPADDLYRRHQRDGDARGFGARWGRLLHALVVPSLLDGLAGGRADPRAHDVAQRLTDGAAARLAADPQPTSLPLTVVTLVKGRA